jgi:hypothetical protein
MNAKDIFPKEPDFTKWLAENPKHMVDLLTLCDVPTSTDDLDCFAEVSVEGGRIDIWEDLSCSLVEANYGNVDKEHLSKPNYYCYGMSQKYHKTTKRIITLTERSNQESRGYVKHQNENTNYDWYLVEFNVGYTKNMEIQVNFHLIVSPPIEKVVKSIKPKNTVDMIVEQLENNQRNTTKPDYRNDSNLNKLQGLTFFGNVGKGSKSVSYEIEWVGPGDFFKSNHGFEGTLNSVGFRTRDYIAKTIQKRTEFAANGSTWKMVSTKNGMSIDEILSQVN